MSRQRGGRGPRGGSGVQGSERTARRRERLRLLEHGREEVAVAFYASEGLPHPEAARRDLLGQLLPAERRRDRGARLRAHRVDARDRLPPPVLAGVEEDAAPLRL